MSEPRLTVNSPTVISEVIDGEAVIMDMSKGRYYSCRDLGGEIWKWIEKGIPRSRISQNILSRYEVDADVLAAALDEFLSTLSAQGLVRQEDGANWSGDPHMQPGVSGGERLPFQPPVLSTHADLEDVLLLDPIHDVDETGWPAPKPPEGASGA